MISHKKSELFRHHAGQQLSEKANAELLKHKDAANIRGDNEQFIARFIEIVIKENPAWSNDADIESELTNFLRACRIGDVKLFGTSSMAYAEGYRLWKKAQNFVSASATAEHHIQDLYNIPSDYSNAKYWGLDECELYDHNVQRRWNLVARLKSIESHMKDNAKTIEPGRVELFRDEYRKARDLFFRMSGQKWEVVSGTV
jgi:hypothetical protein